MSMRIVELAVERQQRRLFEGLSFVLKPGDLLHCLGRNGVGKSSLLAALAGLIPIAAGLIERDDCRLFYLSHKNAVLPHLTVLEQLTLDPLNHISVTEAQVALQLFDLLPLSRQRAGSLSQGQKQRIALMRFYLSTADVYLLDEPFNACDEKTCEQIKAIMQSKCHAGSAICFTSHQTLERSRLAGLRQLSLDHYALNEQSV